MNRERMKELLPVMKAYAEGKTVEYRIISSPAGARWATTSNPAWAEGFDYRVKKEPRTVWVLFNKNGYRMTVREDEALARSDKAEHEITFKGGAPYSLVKFVEEMQE